MNKEIMIELARLHERLARIENVQRAILERTMAHIDEPITIDEMIERLTGQKSDRPITEFEKLLKDDDHE